MIMGICLETIVQNSILLNGFGIKILSAGVNLYRVSDTKEWENKRYYSLKMSELMVNFLME